MEDTFLRTVLVLAKVQVRVQGQTVQGSSHVGKKTPSCVLSFKPI